MTFFRKEVFENTESTIEGKYVNIFPANHYYLIWTLVVFLLLALIAAHNISHSTKVTVKGMLIPQKGIINVHSFAAGYVQTVLVENRQRVKKGDPLFTLSTSNTSASQHFLEQARKNHQANIEMLQKNLEGLTEQYKQHMTYFSETESLLQASVVEMNNKLKLQKENLAMLQEVVAKLDALENQAFFSEFEMFSRRAEMMTEKKSASNFELQKLDILKLMTKLTLERSQIKADMQAKQAQLQLQKRTEQKQLMELELSQEQTVLAPSDGMVSSMTLLSGSFIDSSETVLRLLPQEQG